MKVTFGEWTRWQLARLGLDRSAVARQLGISTKSVTNLYRRPTPDGVNDVTISRLAKLLGLTEPELLTTWQQGLPATETPEAAAKSKLKLPQSVLLQAWFERQDETMKRKVMASLPQGRDAETLQRAAARFKGQKKKRGK